MLRNYRLFLTALAVCALALSAAPSRADDEDDDRDGDRENSQGWDGDRGDGDHRDEEGDRDDDEDDDNDRDHDHHRDHGQDCRRFRGTINLDQGLILTPTTNAPAGARGNAHFVLVNDNGTNYEMLFVRTIGLTNSVYTVELADDTGTNTFNLGTLNVVTKTNLDAGCHFKRNCGPWGGGTNAPSPGYTRWVRETVRKEVARNRTAWSKLMHLSACTNLYTFATNAYRSYTNTLSVGSGSFLLPDGLSQSNATVLTISDSTNVVLMGDFSTATNSTIVYKEIANLIPGTATGAQGAATITYRLARGKAVGTFKLQATGLPPSERLYLTADGTNTVRVFTGSQGALTVRSFRRLDWANVQNIVATDTSSNVVFSVHF
ncbi:MAG TPA: hypothetical protein VNH84_11310 [Candidatus Saccharimonadales bacterium]|nr:hypothetical protein [Candidatus Saccharimonadales bacterium]